MNEVNKLLKDREAFTNDLNGEKPSSNRYPGSIKVLGFTKKVIGLLVAVVIIIASFKIVFTRRKK